MGGGPSVQPRLQDLLGRIEAVVNGVADLRKEAEDIGDRMFGPTPEVATDAPLPPGEDGEVGRLFSAVDNLQILVSGAADRVARLRGL